MKFVLIGAGQRGTIYATYARERGHEIAAVAERDPVRRRIVGDALGVPEDRRFAEGAELLALPRLGEAAIIATMDRDHYAEAIPAMEKGYHLLLEKPISPDPGETLAIERAADRTGRHVTVCHVLRYSPFFREVKKAIDSGKIGRVITIQHNENIGNFHIAHSFVRGNWRRSDLASPLIMQKSCHDMDLLVWLAGSGCESLASFGVRGPVLRMPAAGNLPLQRLPLLSAGGRQLARHGADGGSERGGTAEGDCGGALRPVRIPLR